jgi:hypothetical protein
MTPAQLRRALGGFAPGYAADWECRLLTEPAVRAAELGRILRRWQATRPRPMRRDRMGATHRPQYPDDLLASAQRPVRALQRTELVGLAAPTAAQRSALCELWAVFSRLTVTGAASSPSATQLFPGPTQPRPVTETAGGLRPCRRGGQAGPPLSEELGASLLQVDGGGADHSLVPKIARLPLLTFFLVLALIAFVLAGPRVPACLGPVNVTAVQCWAASGYRPELGLGVPLLFAAVGAAVLAATGFPRPLRVASLMAGAGAVLVAGI